MAWDVRMSINALVTTMKRQDRHQEEHQKNHLKKFTKTHHLVACPYVTKLSSTNQRAEGKVKMLAFTRLDNRREALPVHTDQLATRLQVVVMTNFIRMLSGNVIVNVFKSDAVIWWAAIFRTPQPMLDKLLHLSKSRSSAMSCLRSHDLRDAISNFLTVSMHLQDSLSRFHRPGLPR